MYHTSIIHIKAFTHLHYKQFTPGRLSAVPVNTPVLAHGNVCASNALLTCCNCCVVVTSAGDTTTAIRGGDDCTIIVSPPPTAVSAGDSRFQVPPHKTTTDRCRPALTALLVVSYNSPTHNPGQQRRLRITGGQTSVPLTFVAPSSCCQLHRFYPSCSACDFNCGLFCCYHHRSLVRR